MNSCMPFLIMSCMLSETVVSVSISADKTSPENGTQVILTCSITGVNVTAFWSNNVTDAVLTSCIHGGPCSPPSTGKYSFSANASAIVVQISSFDSSDDFGWKCQHDGNTAVFKFVFTSSNTSPSLTSNQCQLEFGLEFGLGLGIQCVITGIVVVIFIYTGYKYAYSLGLVHGLSLGLTFQAGWIIIVSLISTGNKCNLELGLGLGLGPGMQCVITSSIAVIFAFFTFCLFEGNQCQLEFGLEFGLGLGIQCVITGIVVVIFIYTGYKYAYSLGLVHGLSLGLTFQAGWIIIVSLISTGNKCNLELGLGLGLGPGMQCVITSSIAVIFAFFTFCLFEGIPKRVELGKGILTGLLFASFIGIIVLCLMYDKLKPEQTSIKPEEKPGEPADKKSKTNNSGSSSAVSRDHVSVQMESKGFKSNEEDRPPTVHTKSQDKVEPNIISEQTNYRQQPLPPVDTEFEDTPYRRLPQPPQNREIKDRNLRGISGTIDDTPGLASETPRPNKLPPLTPKQTVQKEDASEEPKKKKKKKKKDQMNVEIPEEENGETIL